MVAMYRFQVSLHMVCGVIWKVRAELYQVHPQTRRRVKVQPPSAGASSEMVSTILGPDGSFAFAFTVMVSCEGLIVYTHVAGPSGGHLKTVRGRPAPPQCAGP